MPPRVPRRLPILGESSAGGHVAKHRSLDGSGAPLRSEVRDVDRVRPIHAVWETTLQCDLACRHCGSRAGHPRDGELSTDEALDLVGQLADLGVLEVTLIGGEVYLRDDWLTIARAVRDAGMLCTIVTGGRGFSPLRARQARDAGVQSVSVSIDGPAAEHDALRGLSGSFQAAMAALDNLRQAGIQTSVNSQIGRTNLSTLPRLATLLDDTGIHAWQIQITVALGRAADNPHLLLEPYQMIELLPMLAALASRCQARGIRLLPANNVGYFGPCESTLRGDLPGGHRAPCGAGRSTVGIEAHGDVKGCPSLPSADYVGGNLRAHSLRAIWERAPAISFTRTYSRDDLWGYCHDCYYADSCRAGCTWTAHALFGRRGNNPFCHHRALELQRHGKRERLVPKSPAPGVPFDHGLFDLIVEEWPGEPRLRPSLEKAYSHE